MTFQQALMITRKWKNGSLWIHSLCIIQNDILDWETEAPKIGNVFAFAARSSSMATIGRAGVVGLRGFGGEWW